MTEQPQTTTVHVLAGSWMLTPTTGWDSGSSKWSLTRRTDTYDDLAEHPIVWIRDDGSAIIDRPIDHDRWFLMATIGPPDPTPQRFIVTPDIETAKGLNYYYHDWAWTMEIAFDQTVNLVAHHKYDKWPTA